MSSYIQQKKESFLYGANAAFLEEMQYLCGQGENLQPEEWKELFQEMGDSDLEVEKSLRGAPWQPNGSRVVQLDDGGGRADSQDEVSGGDSYKHELRQTDMAGADHDLHMNVSAARMVNYYRSIGHMHANLDPLGLQKQQYSRDLDPEKHFSEQERHSKLSVNEVKRLCNVPISSGITPDQLSRSLKAIYSGSVGVEFMHISSSEEREWIEQRFEQTNGRWSCPKKKGSKRYRI